MGGRGGVHEFVNRGVPATFGMGVAMDDPPWGKFVGRGQPHPAYSATAELEALCFTTPTGGKPKRHTYTMPPSVRYL